MAASHPEEDLDNLPALIQERKQFSSQLQSFGDVEKWLSNKSSKNELEKRLWKHIKTHRAERRAEELAVTDNVSRYCVTSALGSLRCIFYGSAAAAASIA